ncbi:hypothetical protein NDU88_001202, partial [Pleurodeles waltl]
SIRIIAPENFVNILSTIVDSFLILMEFSTTPNEGIMAPNMSPTTAAAVSLFWIRWDPGVFSII